MSEPCISQYVQMSKQNNGQISVFNKLTKKTFIIGENEYNVLIHLDGNTSVSELARISPKFSTDDIEKLIVRFEQCNFVKGKETKTKQSILKLQYGILNPNVMISKDSFFTSFLYFIIVYCSIPVLILGLFLNRSNLYNYLNVLAGSFQTPRLLMVVPILLLVLLLHELGHTIVARHYDINVPEFGIMLYWFMPCAYVNLSGTAFTDNKVEKILSYMGGILVNILLSGLAFLMLEISFQGKNDLLLWFAVSNLLSSFVNTFVFLKLDGYYIFEILIDEKNLREKSLGYVVSTVKSYFGHLSSNFKNAVTIDMEVENSMDTILYMVFGVLSILFMPVIILSISITIIQQFF